MKPLRASGGREASPGHQVERNKADQRLEYGVDHQGGAHRTMNVPGNVPGNVPAAGNHRAYSTRKRLRAAGTTCSRSRRVRKSMVPKARSQAGGPQILAPTPRYVRSSLGNFTGTSGSYSLQGRE